MKSLGEICNCNKKDERGNYQKFSLNLRLELLMLAFHCMYDIININLNGSHICLHKMLTVRLRGVEQIPFLATPLIFQNQI